MAALKLPIDTSGFTFTASTPPEPVMDRETNAQKADENGEALFSIQVVAFGEGGAQIWAVKFPGAAPAGVKRGADVKLTGLCAGCPSAHMTLYLGVETALREEIPEFETLRVV